MKNRGSQANTWIQCIESDKTHKAGAPDGEGGTDKPGRGVEGAEGRVGKTGKGREGEGKRGGTGRRERRRSFI